MYKYFRLVEPWDSEHNKQLIEKMPEVYRSAADSAADDLAAGGHEAGETCFQRPHGERLISEVQIERGFSDGKDGTNNSIMTAQVFKARP